MKKSKLTSAHWGTYEVGQGIGKDFKLLPFKDDKDPSEIGRGIETALESNSRIRNPSIRKRWLESKNKEESLRTGKDEFVEVSWKEAFELAGTEIKRIISTRQSLVIIKVNQQLN